MRRLWLLVLLACSGCPAPNGGEASWSVMGTIAQVKWNDTKDHPLYEVAPSITSNVFSRVERLLNAHDPNSELSRLAALSDAEVLAQCSPEVRPCYAVAFKLRDQTGGRFNPRWRGPKTLDLGAIAKGFAVDLAAAAFADMDDCRLLIDLGGNLKAVGGRGWTVGIKDGGSFELKPGAACATSANYFRGSHIKDGRTGAAITNAVYSVTVVHPNSAMLADGLSTVMFLLGKREGDEFLRQYYPEATACWIFRE